MRKRRRFTADFKAKVALEALRGDQTIQQIATRHKVHPNQVSTWKAKAVSGLGAVFSNSTGKAQADRDSEVHDLHAKIGQLTVVLADEMNLSMHRAEGRRVRLFAQAHGLRAKTDPLLCKHYCPLCKTDRLFHAVSSAQRGTTGIKRLGDPA